MAEDGFLGRWARRKAAAGVAPGRRPGRGGAAPVIADETSEIAALPEDAPVQPRAVARPERPGVAEPSEPAEEAPASEAEIAALPDIDSLDAHSDFTGFLRKGVPEALQRQALRKLWPLDPVLANVDGLVDYGEDFTQAASLVANIKTSYQVGRGYQTDEDLARNDQVYRAEQEAKLAARAEENGEAAPPGEPDDTALAEAETDGDDEKERDVDNQRDVGEEHGGGAEGGDRATAGDGPAREIATAPAPKPNGQGG